MKAGVLLSKGVHPASRRPRAAHADVAALQLVRGTGLQACGLHAGSFHEALRDYGGYGLQRLTVTGDDDASACAQVLAQLARSSGAEILVAGMRGESPQATGMLPYKVARELGWTVLVNIERLEWDGTRLAAIVWLDATTRRRFFDVRHTVLLARAQEASIPFAASQAAKLDIECLRGAAVPASGDSAPTPPTRAHPSPPWLLPHPDVCAAQRLATLRGDDGSARRGEIVPDASPEEAAARLLQLLHDTGFHPQDPEGDTSDD